MSRRSKTLDWKTNSIKIDFSNTPESPLGWALKIISEYKVLTANLTVHNNSDLKVSIPDIFLHDPKGELVRPNDNINVALDLVQADWNTLLLWVAKDRWKLFDISSGPLPEVVMRIHEPRAKFVIAELNLWDAIYDANREFKTALAYDNCVEAWRGTQLESKRDDFSYIFRGGPLKEAIDLVKQKAQMKVNKNPFCLSERNKVHHHNMIAAALSVARGPGKREQEAVENSRNKFRREAWHPYLNAMGEYIKSLRNGVLLPDGSRVKPKTIFIKEGDLMLQEGRQAKKLWPILRPIPKKDLHQRGKYQRN